MAHAATDDALTSAPLSKRLGWIGWILSIVPVLMLVMSAVMKFVRPASVLDGFDHLGWSRGAALEAACTVVYLIPRTAVLGAILLTGYLGGAISTHVRIGEAWYAPFGLGELI